MLRHTEVRSRMRSISAERFIGAERTTAPLGRHTAATVIPFIISTEGIIDEAWCRNVKRAMMTDAFAQFLRDYASDRGGIKPSPAKRYAMADIIEKAAAYTEIGERCSGTNETFNVAEAAESTTAVEAYFNGLSRTCDIEGRIMVREHTKTYHVLYNGGYR
jgi:hypothetical protein